MKKSIVMSLLLGFILILTGCGKHDTKNELLFATSADYPPFEYEINGELVGFDIELGKLIAEKLGKKAKFQDMQFGSILVAVKTGMVDAAIATITITDERKKNFDFSQPYYKESLAVVFHKKQPIKTIAELANKKIACQLGTTMEIWLKKHATHTKIITTDSNPQAIEALKAGHVDGVFIDTIQAIAFSKKNSQLFYSPIAKSDTGYSIVLKKGSSLKEKIDKAIISLEKAGDIKNLKKKYLYGE